MTAAPYLHRSGMLSGAVRSAAVYDLRGQPTGEHRGLPSPTVTFVVGLDAPIRVRGTVDDAAEAPATAYDVLLAGLHPVAARVEQPAAQRGVQLALHPLAAPALLGCRTADLVGVGTQGEEVLGREVDTLRDRLVAAGSARAQLDLVESWLRDRYDGAPRSAWAVRPEVAAAWDLAARTRGRSTVEELSRHVLLGPRQLRLLMLRELGISPKRLCRVFRFDHAVALLVTGRHGLAETAVLAGYADQAHLAREFREMAGCPPTTWLREERRNIQDGGHQGRTG